MFGLLRNQVTDEWEEEEAYEEEEEWESEDEVEGPVDFYDEYDEAEVDF